MKTQLDFIAHLLICPLVGRQVLYRPGRGAIGNVGCCARWHSVGAQ
jgi:hypothetical protein